VDGVPLPTRRRPVVVVLATLVAAMAGALVLIILGGLVLALRMDDNDGAPPPRRGDGLVPASVDRDTPVPQPAALPADVDLARWAADVAGRENLPARVVRAYGAAELAQRERTPDCRLSWVTLAGIGRVESLHGTYGGSEVDADGVARPSIIGVPLDGTRGTREVADTDAGRLDGDTELDRAVGPMQFLPATWQRFGADGNDDGVRDPQNVDDAALAAAGYLCAEDRDTATGEGWWDGVLTYNASGDYARLVWAAAERYGSGPVS
jgi:hypothetical protein